MTLDKPVELTEADVAEPVQLTEADVAEPVQLTEADVAEPVQLTEADVGGRSAAGGIAREIKEQASEIARQGAAGVVRDLPRMAWNTAAALLPGETPSAENPQGSGAAGFAGQVAEEIASAEEKAAWDDPKKKGWAAVPGMAARSLAPNLLVGVATGGAGVAAMPFLYGGSRAQEVFARLRDKAQERGEEFDETAARLNAAAAGGLEGGLEYVSNLFGMNRQIRELMRPGAKAAAGAAREAAAKGLAAGLRRLAGTMLKEGGTELIQEGGGELHEQLIGISDSLEKRPETLAEVDWDAVWERAKYAAAAGALSSGAVGAVQNAATRVRERRAARAETAGRQAQGGEETGLTRRRGDAEAGADEGLASQAEPWEDAAEEAETADAVENTAEAGDEAAEAAAPAASAEIAARAEEAAKAARKADRAAWVKANTGKGANVSDQLQRDNPVAARVLELGGIRLDGTEEDRAIPLAFRSATGQRLDQMLTELQADEKTGGMVADWTTDDLREALQGNTRKAARTARERPVTPDEREWLKSGSVTVGQENLALGFTFTVKGIGYEVADADDAGYVLRQTGGAAAGREFRLDHGGMITIDRDSMKSANGRKIAKMAVRARPEDLARFERAAQARDAAARAEAEALGLTVEEEVRGKREEVRGEEDEEDLPFREGGGKIQTVNAGQATRDISADEIAQRDAEYLKAVEDGVLYKAQKLVNYAEALSQKEIGDISSERLPLSPRLMPVEWIQDTSVKTPRFVFGRNGFVRLISVYPLDRSEQYFLVNEATRKTVLPDGRFYRFTNNKNEISMAKKGVLRNSRNFADGTSEVGVSVASHPGYSMQGYKYGYIVEGEIAGYGSDGEPVLVPDSIKVVSKLMTDKEIDAVTRMQAQEAKSKFMNAYGWSENQFNAFRGNLVFLRPNDYRTVIRTGKVGWMTEQTPDKTTRGSDAFVRDSSGRIIPLSERFPQQSFDRQPGEDSGSDADEMMREAAGRPARDAEYLDAVERGDMETAQRMVDEEAYQKGYEPSDLYHGTDRVFNVYRDRWFGDADLPFGIFFSSDENAALKFAEMRYEDSKRAARWTGDKTAIKPLVNRSYLRFNAPLVIETAGKNHVEIEWHGNTGTKRIALSALRGGYDAVIFKDLVDQPISNELGYGFSRRNELHKHDVIAVRNADQIKSADPVTRDDQGNVIPLSQRFNGEEDDIRYREAAGTPSPDPSPAAPSSLPPASGLRVIRRGYDAERGAADDPAYSRFGQYPMDLPELVELAEDLLDGKTPRVVSRVNPKGTALGSVRFAQERSDGGAPVYGRPETIKLLAANYKLVSDDEVADWQAQADAKFGAGTEAAKAAFDETYMAELKERMKKGPRLAMAVIAHEIGHVADQLSRVGLKKIDRSVGKNRLNLVGRVAGMLAYTRDILAKEPDGRTLAADEVRALQGLARRHARPDAKGKELWRAVAGVWGDILTARPELKGTVSAGDLQAALEEARDRLPVLSEWFGITSFQEQTRMVRETLEAFANPGAGSGQQRRMGGAWFRREFVARLERERQAHLGQMYSELESLIAWWNNGDRSMMPAYFERPSEMFAEAFGAFLNNPAAVQKRAPTFYTTLMAHMDARPQLAAWYDGFNAAMRGGKGNVTAHRHYRAHEMFSEETRRERRQLYDAVRRATGKRTAWDAAKFTGVSKSMPIRAVVRAAETLGLKGLADGASAMADRIENLRGLEELYRTMNLEIGKILDEGDLDVADFDTWALYDMVERSPAYVDKANPRGLHPAAAKELKANYRNTLGPQKAETLERAVAKAQDIWQREIVDRLEQWGGLAPETLAYIRGNPVYFTLQVGMDDAEVRQWQKALQSGDQEAITALAQRSVEMHDVGGRRVGPEIVARTGTHRPAVSLLGATMLKGQALLNAAAHNEMQRQLHGLLKAVNDPLFTPVPEGQTARDTASQVVCKFRENAVVDGKPVNREVQFYAPKFVGHFARGDNPTSNLNRWVQGTKFYAAHQALKMFQTILSAKFISTQPMSDRKAWNTQMPGVRTPLGNIARGSVIGGLAQMIPASTWILPAGVFPAGSRERLMRPMRDVARAYYRTGKVGPELRRLIERGMYDLGGAWQGIMGDNPHPGEIIGGGPLSQQPRSFKPYAQDLSAFAKAWQRLESVPAFGALFRGAGAAVQHAQEAMYDETLANKLAGMTYLDEKYPDMPERQKREWVLKSAGNPNFASRAGADPLIDSLGWAFYNPAKEGWLGAWHAAANDPKGFAVRAAYYNLLPNLIAKGAKYGVPTALAGLLIPHGDTPEEEDKRNALLRGFANWCRLYGRISSYYGKRHVAVPIMPVGTDSALIVTIPQAQSFSPLNSLINIGIDEAAQAAGLAPDDDKLIEKAVNAVTGELQGVPTLLGTSRGMLQQTLGPALALMFTKQTNVYDPFYERMMLDQDEETLMKGGKHTARALPAWEKVFKSSWNSAFGSMVARFDTKTPRADAAQKSGLQKILTSPGIGTLIGGWLRVTGGGEYESIQELFAPEAAERARQTIMARRAAVETINSKDGSFPGWAAERLENDPGFRKAYNRFRLRSEIYEGLTPAEKVMVNRSNPRWKREIIINKTLNDKR